MQYEKRWRLCISNRQSLSIVYSRVQSSQGMCTFTADIVRALKLQMIKNKSVVFKQSRSKAHGRYETLFNGPGTRK